MRRKLIIMFMCGLIGQKQIVIINLSMERLVFVPVKWQNQLTLVNLLDKPHVER